LKGNREILACILALLCSTTAFGVLVDRIAVAVGDKIITDSEIEQRIRLTAFENHQQPDFGLAARQMAVAKLVDERLIEKEMDVGRYPRIDAAHKQELLAGFLETDYKGDSAELDKALAAARLKKQELEDDLGRQSDLLTFLNLRFRPAVQVTDEDVQKYYEANMKGAVLNDVRADIEQKLTMERADKELDVWLVDQKKRTKIEYLEKDLK
jgi:hypothetical protein